MVMWWDTQVHGVQILDSAMYADLRNVLKPQGGGGTRVSCVNDYISREGITADCCVVFTDGYVEDQVQWDISIPTLWLITMSRSFTPPVGKSVKFN